MNAGRRRWESPMRMHARNPVSYSAAMLLGACALAAGTASITTVAGTGVQGHAGDAGPAVEAKLDQPFHCSKDRQGNLYIAEAGSHCIRKVDAKTCRINTVAGTGQKGYSGDG